MKSKSFISSKNNGFNDQFKALNYKEMINLRGGDSIPPTTPGPDYPIDPLKASLTSTNYTSYTLLQLPPVLVA